MKKSNGSKTYNFLLSEIGTVLEVGRLVSPIENYEQARDNFISDPNDPVGPPPEEEACGN